MPHKTANIFIPRSSPVKPSKPIIFNKRSVICQSNRFWSKQIKASHKSTEQHSIPNNNMITLGWRKYSLQTLQIISISITASTPKKLYSITPYIPNSRPKPKPAKKNVTTISKRLKAVNDRMDWTVLFIALLLVMGRSLPLFRWHRCLLSTYLFVFDCKTWCKPQQYSIFVWLR